MVSDKVNFDIGAGGEDGNYKSNFARSMAVNSQYRDKSLDFRQLHGARSAIDCKGSFQNQKTLSKPPEPPEVVRLRKITRLPLSMAHIPDTIDLPTVTDDIPRLSCPSNTSSRRTSLCLNRLPDQPVEYFILQSQIDTLQWQLKETESSREMYRAVMRQVVIFLERAHRSLELLGSRISTQRVSRTQSEYHVNTTLNETINDDTMTDCTNLNGSELGSQKEISWRRLKKQEPSPDEIPPEKLSQEAFRLLRTAQSLLSTHEPDLARVTASNSEEDLHFLAQLAKEFPPVDPKPQRTTSFSLCPKLLTPEKDMKISTALNRKLSLQLNDNLRRSSFLKDVSTKLNLSNESSRSSVAENDCIPSSTLIDDNRSIKSISKFKYEKSSSPPVSSVGSAEDESGFSSMNSFQEVGLPSVPNSVDDPKETLLKTMLHNNTAFAQNCHNDFFRKDHTDDIKLWQTPNVIHKRWSSTPVDNISTEKASMKVLWV